MTSSGPGRRAPLASTRALALRRRLASVGARARRARPALRTPGSPGPAGDVGGARPDPAHELGAAPAGRPLVLVIDDEHSVRAALRRYFQRYGWDVEEAEDGAQALRLLDRPEASAYRLVITDLRMPGRTGVEVHDWLQASRPELFARLIIATGDVASPPIQEFLQRTPRPVLEKPFELSALAAVVARVLGGG